MAIHIGRRCQPLALARSIPTARQVGKRPQPVITNLGADENNIVFRKYIQIDGNLRNVTNFHCSKQKWDDWFISPSLT
jgi:hypothetical protein